jgi:hypothetical protein
VMWWYCTVRDMRVHSPIVAKEFIGLFARSIEIERHDRLQPHCSLFGLKTQVVRCTCSAASWRHMWMRVSERARRVRTEEALEVNAQACQETYDLMSTLPCATRATLFSSTRACPRRARWTGSIGIFKTVTVVCARISKCRNIGWLCPVQTKSAQIIRNTNEKSRSRPLTSLQFHVSYVDQLCLTC